MNRPGNMDRLMDRTRHTCRWLLAPALMLLLSDVAAAELPPPCGPFPATADATTVPAGTYQVAYLTLEKGWLAKTDVNVVLGLRDANCVTAWFVAAPPNRFNWVRDLAVQLEGDSLKGRLQMGAAEGEVWLDYTLEAKVDGTQVTGTFHGRNTAKGKTEELTGNARGTLVDEAQLKTSQALAAGQNWSSWYGEAFANRGPGSATALVEDLAQARPVWKSEELAGPGYGCAPDNRYGPNSPANNNIGSGASSPVVAGGLVYWYYYVPNGEPDEKGMWLKMWREGWAKTSKPVPSPVQVPEPGAATADGVPTAQDAAAGQKAPFPSKAFDFHRPVADDVVVAIDAATGKTAWRTVFAKRNVNIQTHKHRGLNPTPFVQDGVVYASSYASVFYALDARTGKVLWEYDKIKTTMPNVVGPVVADGVVAALGSHLAGLDAKSGQELWKVKLGFSGNVLKWTSGGKDRFIMIANDLVDRKWQSKAICLEPRTGTIVWTAPILVNYGGGMQYQPLIEGDLMVTMDLGTPPAGSKPGETDFVAIVRAYRLKPDGLEQVWEVPGSQSIVDSAAVAIANGCVYTTGSKETLCLDLATGKELGRVQGVGGARTHVIQATAGRVFVQPEGRHGGQHFQMLKADSKDFRALPGPAQWSPPHPQTTAYACHPISTPVVDGRMFTRGADGIYCYDLRSEKKP